MKDRADLLTKFFKDGTGKIVIWQTPNAPLIGWAVSSALAHILPSDGWQLLAGYVSFGFIFTWAWLELTQGSSYFRRVLGAVVLAMSIYSRLG